MIEYGYRVTDGPRGGRYFQAYIGDKPIGGPRTSLQEVLSYIEYLKSLQTDSDPTDPEPEVGSGPGF